MNRFIRDKRIKQSAIFLLGFTTLMWSCKKEDSDIGLGIQPEADILNATAIDTFQFNAYTRLEDSLRSDELSTNLLGSIVDPVFGKTTSTVYTQFGLATTISSIDIANTVVDSVRLQMRYSGYYGKLDPQTFTVQRITERFYKDSAIYSNRTLAASGVELIIPGFETVTPDYTSNVVVGSDTLDPMLLLKLDNGLGTDIVNSINSGNLTSESAFSNFLYGLRIGVNNPTQAIGSGAILYLDLANAQSKLLVYYHENGTAKQLSMPIGLNQGRFSNFVHDYTGTPVGDQLASPALGQRTFYAQTMAGVETVLEIPGIENLKKMGNVIINKAEVYFPVQYFTSNSFKPSPNAFLFYKNSEGTYSVTVDQVASFATYGGAYNDAKKAYVFNIGRHLQRVVRGELPNLGYVINTSSSSVTAQRIVFNGQQTLFREKPYLKVYYTKY